MKFSHRSCAALIAAALFASCVSAQTTIPNTNLRRTPVVEAVARSKPSVVVIRVPRPGHKDMIGTGFIVDKSGLIVTNRHVTGGEKTLKVRLHDGTDLVGRVVVTDCDWDLAVVRIDISQLDSNKPLTEVQFAPSADLMLGEPSIAIGNPHAYEFTVSVGIIAALNREITMPNEVTINGLIQTTAPINPGNSGGPLLNINGEVIGVTVALRDGAQNIAFAINSTMVKTFLNRHYNAKRFAGVDHGMKYEEKVLGEFGDRQRVVVKNASYSEIKPGDEILAIENKKVGNGFDLERSFWHKRAGEQVSLKVNRGGNEMNVMVTLGEGAGQVAAVSTETPLANNQAATTKVRSAAQH